MPSIYHFQQACVVNAFPLDPVGGPHDREAVLDNLPTCRKPQVITGRFASIPAEDANLRA
jgi:hypothetical protein